MMSKVPKGEEKTRGKNGKTAKCVWIDIQLSKLRFEASVNVFVSRLVLAERKGDFVFNIMYGKFWFEGDFFVQNLDASMELRQYQSLSQGKSSFFSWQIGTLSFLTDWYSFFLLWALFFFFSPTTFFRFWFSISKDFSLNKKLSRVSFVKCSM